MCSPRNVGTGTRSNLLGMDFELSPEMDELRHTVRRLAQEKIKPRAREIDATGEYPQDIFDELATLICWGCASLRSTGDRARGSWV